MNIMDIQDLKGEVLTHIDVADAEIMLTTESGKKIRIYHDQDCCESVSIYDINGDIHKLIGKTIVDTSEELDRENRPSEHVDSFTWTTHTFQVNDATVIVKWFGESNGYYSENITIREITKE